MIKNSKEFSYKDLTYKIIGLVMEAHKKLGHGFLEKVYENALLVLCRKNKSLEYKRIVFK